MRIGTPPRTRRTNDAGLRAARRACAAFHRYDQCHAKAAPTGALSRPMPNHITLIDATIDRIDTNLIRVASDIKKVSLYRLTMQGACYFIAADDIDAEAFKQIDRLKPGMAVRACVFDDRGRRSIAWIKGNDVAIAPYNVFRQKSSNVSLLIWASCIFMLSLLIDGAAFKSGWAFVGAVTLVVGIISLLGTLLAIAGLSELVFRPQRREAQEKWQYEPASFTAERSNR
ncbi:hypothetical protein [Burkholderia contaminans]|uniref:hypothetical protein n=1 Tax=Burkholderia contaminans TaxID=488447 RepID=UPI001F2AB34A|nr:hypothetical protein [Burkholderia contaminans]MEB4635494.1 hypothetical protein [Burkholderia contaminans]MEB4651284.1 hypothetical protein [Burkholderia contaminans]MEB4661825.1 hypothetical protein [Burkholderia contaminans]MEB4666563.1 hypothetical protein [Burkholderia contaminans]MEB4680027.1 hypothetical protein [Burkholderia contaminans]